MNPLNSPFLRCLLLLFFSSVAAYAGTVDQRLVVVQNDQTAGGNFQVAVQAQTDVTGANTLCSATTDVQFDNTKLTYVSATYWAIGIESANGYTRSAVNNTTYIRVYVLGNGVNENGGGNPPGHDIPTSYETWVQLNFTIASASGTTDLAIASGSNAVSLFNTHKNDPNTGANTAQSLTRTNTTNEPLPIELTSLIASVARGNDVEVAWKTVSETNNYGFEIYRKRGENGEWKEITFVEGHGTTLAAQSYTYLDRSLGFGKYSYQVKQVDLDGKSKAFPEVDVTVGVGPGMFILAQNYPNPFNPSTVIEFVVPQTGYATLKVYNLLGQEVAIAFEGIVEAEQINTARFDATSLPSGVYFYTLRSGGKVDTKRMLLMR
jgi:hypothetical protein